MTDFSHLHALEERAVRIRERMIDVQKNDAQWKAQAVQLFQTEKEIADEREFLGLEDISADDLYAGLIEEHESEVVREVTAIANAEEQGKRFFLKGGVEIARRYGQWALYDVSGSIVDHYDSLEKALSAHGQKGGMYER